MKAFTIMLLALCAISSAHAQSRPDPACENFSDTLGCVDTRLSVEPREGSPNIDSEAMGIIDEEVDKIMQKPTPEEAADIWNWIPYACCRSNTCCRKVSEKDLTPYDRGKYLVNETGQVKDVLKWSRDGQVWRCACDWDNKKGKWIVHPKANTRCVFPVPQGM